MCKHECGSNHTQYFANNLKRGSASSRKRELAITVHPLATQSQLSLQRQTAQPQGSVSHGEPAVVYELSPPAPLWMRAPDFVSCLAGEERLWGQQEVDYQIHRRHRQHATQS